jgi:benzoyl-CoA reductase subunit B
MKGQIWETKPLEFWTRAKELRAKWEKSSESTESLVGQGNTSGSADWARAFPAITVIEDNPLGSTIAAKDFPFARRCRLASDIRGWGREICGYHGVIWGCQFLGRQMDGNPFPNRKFVVPIPCVCDSHAKRGQQARDFAPVPQWMNDFTMYLGDYDAEREKAMLDHKCFNTLRMINDIERIFGQKFDDEKMVEMIRAASETRQYMKETFFCMTHKPAPLSAKDIYSIFVLGGLAKFAPREIADFWKLVRDEVQWRVDNNIAAVGNERFRWMEAHPPAYYFLKYYRYMEKYGAVCIGSQYTNFNAAQFERKPDGSIAPREYPRYPEDTPLLTREDEFRYGQGLDARLPHHFKQDEYLRPYALNEFADIYQADGAMFNLWRGGIGCVMLRKEQAIRLREAGVSVMHYEGSSPGDSTDFDEKRFLEQLDSWMESNDLRKLED